MKKPKVSVVVVNYNGRAFVAEGVDSILASSFKDFEVVVVDNGSIDGSREYLRNRYRGEKRVRLVELEKNRFFTGGYNRGAGEAEGEWLFLVNSDVRLEKDCLEKLMEFGEGKEIIMQPKLLWADRPGVIDNVGGRYNWWGEGRAVGRDEVDKGRYQTAKYDYANGTAMMLKRKLFWRLGGFDEWYRYFYEDVDLCLRAGELGVECWGVSEAVGYHRGSASFRGKVKDEVVVYHYRKNRLMTLVKNRGLLTLSWSWLTVFPGGVKFGWQAYREVLSRGLELRYAARRVKEAGRVTGGEEL